MKNNNEDLDLQNISHSTASTDSPLEVSKGEKDLLDMKEYHQSLIKFIEGIDESNTPITIALQGEWGSGKTSIMNIIRTTLCEGDDAVFYDININTWKFCMLDSTLKSSSSQAAINILQSMIYQIMALKPNSIKRERVDKIINKIAVISSGAKSIYDIIGEPLLSHIGVNKATVGFVGRAINVLKSVGDKNNKKSEDDNASLIEQLHKEVDDIVKDVLGIKNDQYANDQEQVLPYDNQNHLKYSYLQKDPVSLFDIKSMPDIISLRLAAFLINIVLYVLDLAVLVSCQAIVFTLELISNLLLLVWQVCYYLLNAFSDLCVYFKNQLCNIRIKDKSGKIFNFKQDTQTDTNINNVKKRKGFIFFIDDLDRIQPELALEILEILRNLFDIKHCIFIVAIDPTVLNEAIKKKLGAVADLDPLACLRYFDKFVQISVPAPTPFYDITLMLKKELVRISYFNVDELNSKNLIMFLRDVIKDSISNNPRLLKIVVNKLSFTNIMISELHARQGTECSVFFEKKLNFVFTCMIIAFPGVFNTLSMFPYFREWDDELADAFNIKELNQKLLQQLKLLKKIDLEDRNSHGAWELILFRICQYDDCNNGFNNFEKILNLLKIIDQMFIDEVNGDLNEYKDLIVKFFKFVKGHPLSDIDL